MNDDSTEAVMKTISNVIQIDEERVKGHLDRVVRSTVEQTINDLLDAEADRLVGADRYARTDQRRDYRSGHYTRKLHTKAGEVTVKMPKLRKQTLDTAIIERYKRRESSVAKLSKISNIQRLRTKSNERGIEDNLSQWCVCYGLTGTGFSVSSSSSETAIPIATGTAIIAAVTSRGVSSAPVCA